MSQQMTTPLPNTTTPPASASANRGPDYVYFERTTAGMSDDAVPRAKTAQMKLEHFYTVAVSAAVERNQRYIWIKTKRVVHGADLVAQTR